MSFIWVLRQKFIFVCFCDIWFGSEFTLFTPSLPGVHPFHCVLGAINSPIMCTRVQLSANRVSINEMVGGGMMLYWHLITAI